LILVKIKFPNQVLSDTLSGHAPLFAN